jgi:hypothetical protein
MIRKHLKSSVRSLMNIRFNKILKTLPLDYPVYDIEQEIHFSTFRKCEDRKIDFLMFDISITL